MSNGEALSAPPDGAVPEIEDDDTALPVPHPIGIGLNRARLRAGYSQRQLARYVDMTPGKLGEILSGQRSPTFEQIERIADECGLTPEWCIAQAREVPVLPRRERRCRTEVAEWRGGRARSRGGNG